MTRRVDDKYSWLWYGHQRARDGRHDFELFCSSAPDIIDEFFNSQALAATLRELCGMHYERTSVFSLQIEFGNRSLFRQTYDRETATEKGAALVFSQGPTGDVAVILYPANSNIASWNDHAVFLETRARSGAKLLDRLRYYLSALVDYQCVTSIDAKAPLRAELRIRWLNFWCKRLRATSPKFEHVHSVKAAGRGFADRSASGLVGQISIWILIALAAFALGQRIDLPKFGMSYGISSDTDPIVGSPATQPS